MAFATTEYQQNILLAICLQESIRFKVVFARDNIKLNERMAKVADRVIRIRDIPYSWRNTNRYVREFRIKIEPEIESEESYRVFSHSIESPFVRLLIASTPRTDVQLFEEGAGSYVRWGQSFSGLGLKAYLSSMVLNGFLFFSMLRPTWFRRAVKRGWALYDGCFPDEQLELKMIDHECFRSATRSGNEPDSPAIQTPPGSVIFIQQCYVEMGLMDAEDYVRVHIEAVEKIKNERGRFSGKLLWKLHPRTDRAEEAERLLKICGKSGVEIEILEFDGNMEQMVFTIDGRVEAYFSLGSSSLYVIKTLTEGLAETICISSPLLEQRLPTQVQLLSLFRRVGVMVV